MEFPEEIKRIRQKYFSTQQGFAKEVQVAFSAINRWEGGKAKPSLSAMKNIKKFCLKTMWAMRMLKRRGLILKWRENRND